MMIDPVNAMRNEKEVVRSAGREEAISAFVEAHNCFSIVRESSEMVVVFDARIPIQLAFYALVEHGSTSYSSVSTCRCLCGIGN